MARSKNEHLVADEDLDCYRAATVPGLRQQLSDSNLPTDGLKHDLYQRLVDAGLSLYTEASDEDDSQADQDDVADQDDEADGDQEGDDEPNDDQGGRASPKTGDKRPRVDKVDGGDDDDESDDGGNGPDPDPGPPPRSRRRVAAILPAELQVLLIRSLTPAALWNLIDVAPEEYLNAEPEGGINALVLEARNHHVFDRPPPSPDDSGANDDGGSDDSNSDDSNSDDSNSDDSDSDDSDNSDDDALRPMSLLEWVGRRATYESRFRTANRTRIMRVIDAYLAVYGVADAPEGNVNPRDGILYFFRDRTGTPGPAMTPLSRAAYVANPVAVQLLITRGAGANQTLSNVNQRPLDYAMVGLSMDINGADRMQTIFTLLGAGANVTQLRATTRSHAVGSLEELDVFGEGPSLSSAMLHEVDWPRVENPLDLTIREFIADERSSYFDRVLLALYVIWKGNMSYPRFI